MKMQLIDNVMNLMVKTLDEKQLQELKTALIISLDNYDIVKRETSLSTEVINNWEYAKKYVQNLIISGKSSGTVDTYSLHIKLLLEDINKPLEEVTDDDLIVHLAKQKYSRNLSNKYLNFKRLIFRSFFSWLKKKKYIKENPAELLDKIKYDTTIKKPYTDEEREMIRCSCKRERDLALIDVLYSTAARVSEISALNKTDIDFIDNGCVVHGKGGKERPVYLNAVASYHLKKYLSSRTDDNPALFVSCKKPYGRLSRSGIGEILRELGKTAGVDGVHPHRYRRTALTNAANRGMPLQDIQCLAGHSDPNTTMIYCTVDQHKVKAEHKMFLAS